MPDIGKSRAVLITGAAGGVGVVTTRVLQAHGFRVFAGVRDHVGELEDIPGVHVVRLDVTDPENIADTAAEIHARTGGGLHSVINNAGIIIQGPLELVPADEIRRQFEVNVFGPALVTQAFLPLLRRGRGRLLNVTAPTARLAVPFLGVLSASKAALASLSDATRVELAHWGIPVIEIVPGALETGIFATAAEAARKSLAAIPEETVALYSKQIAMVEKAGASMKAAPPKVVADTILRALTTSNPKARYSVGRDARMGGLVAHLPARTRDRLVRQIMGLSKLRPVAG